MGIVFGTAKGTQIAKALLALMEPDSLRIQKKIISAYQSSSVV
jgi:hypothetical protein